MDVEGFLVKMPRDALAVICSWLNILDRCILRATCTTLRKKIVDESEPLRFFFMACCKLRAEDLHYKDCVCIYCKEVMPLKDGWKWHCAGCDFTRNHNDAMHAMVKLRHAYLHDELVSLTDFLHLIEENPPANVLKNVWSRLKKYDEVVLLEVIEDEIYEMDLNHETKDWLYDTMEEIRPLTRRIKKHRCFRDQEEEEWIPE